jgi:hypothetical protein
VTDRVEAIRSLAERAAERAADGHPRYIFFARSEAVAFVGVGLYRHVEGAFLAISVTDPPGPWQPSRLHLDLIHESRCRCRTLRPEPSCGCAVAALLPELRALRV